MRNKLFTGNKGFIREIYESIIDDARTFVVGGYVHEGKALADVSLKIAAV